MMKDFFVEAAPAATLRSWIAAPGATRGQVRVHKIVSLVDAAPTVDQQIGGIIMWVPAGTIYAGAALALIALWITGAAKQTERTDALHAQ